MGQIRNARVTAKPKKRPGKKAQRIIKIAVASAAVVLIAVFAVLSVTNRFTPQTQDMHSRLNSLPDNLDYMAVLKDGGLYLYKNGSMTLVDEKVYSPSTQAAGSLLYYFNQKDGSILYVSDPNGEKILTLYKNGNKYPVCSDTDSWQLSADYTRVACICGANTSGMDGTLLVFDGENYGNMHLLGYGVKASSAGFSGDGKTVYALGGTAIKSVLLRYIDGTPQTVAEDVSALGFISNNGNVYMSASYSGNMYAYKYATADGAQTLTFDNVYYSSLSPDCSLTWILADYSSTAYNGNLYVLENDTLKCRKVAEKVIMFNPTGVTDSASGMVYSCLSDKNDNTDIYYYSISNGLTVRIAENTASASLGCVAINTAQNKGCIVLKGIAGSTLYGIDINGNTTTLVAQDSIHELLYYEACDTYTYTKGGSSSAGYAELWSYNDNEIRKLLNKCGAIYDSENDIMSACAILANDGRHLIYIKDITDLTTDTESEFYGVTAASYYGTVVMLDIETDTLTVIASNVLADSFDCILADGNMQNVYYCTLRTDGKYDLNCFNTQSGTSTVVAQAADGILLPGAY